MQFPKPKEIKQKNEAVKVYRSGREVCDLSTVAGSREYRNRIRLMLERQHGRCCLGGYIPECPGPLYLDQATFDHETPRGHGGGSRDDRIEIDGKPVNGAAHYICNGLKGSRRIKYNTTEEL